VNGLLVGLGNMGRNHARILAQIAKSVSFVDPNYKSMKNLPKGFSHCFENIEDALDKQQYDFAVVAAPTKFHFEICKRLIEEKVHILVEKPITESLDTAKTLRKLARDNNVKLLPGHIERYNPAIMFLKDKLAGYDLDSVYRIEVLRCSPFPPRITDVGVSYDLSVHDLDVINFLFDKKVTSLFCRKSQQLHSTREDGVICYLNYENDIDCVMNTNWTSPVKKREIRIFGAWGMFTVDFITQEVTYNENPSHIADHGTWGWTGISEGEQTKYNIPKSEPLLNEYNHFFNGIKNNLPFDKEVQSAIDVIKVVAQFTISHNQRAEVMLDQDSDS